MAQDAELKLKVSLDLAFLRQQLSTIGTQLAGQGIDISATIDEDDVVQQYKSLAKTLESKTIKLKVESTTLDALVTKAANLKKNLEEFGKQDISLDIKIASNIAELRKSIKDKLPSVAIDTHLNEPVNVDDFIRGVAKKVKDQVDASYTGGGIPIATKLALPGVTDPLNALQKNLNRQDPLKAKVGTKPSIFKADVTAFQTAVNEKFKDITIKIKAELDTASAAAAQAPATGPSRTFLQELKGLDKNVLQGIYRAAGEDALLAFDEGIINNKASMIQALRDAAKDASDGFLAALENKKSALFKAAGEYAGALLGGLKKELKIQSPSREMFDIGDDAGKGFELGLLKAMELAEKSATNQMRRMLDRLARMALMMAGMSAAAINKQVAQSRALPSVNFPATIPPRQSIPIGPSSTGRSLPAGRAAAGLIGSAQAPAGLLPSATTQGGLTTGLEALIQSLVSQTRGRGPEGPGAIVSMETGFIPAMRERFAKAAERYLFGVETQVMDLFDAALRQVESAVDLHIAKIQGQISQRMRSAFSVVDLGVQGRPMLPGAATGQAPLMLPAAGGTTPLRQMRFNAVRTGEVVPPTPLMLPPAGGTTPRREMRFNAVTSTGGRGGGYVPPGGFPVESMLGGRQGEATFIGAGSQMEKFKTGLDVASQSMKQFRASQIPLVGGLKEIASEFGFAVKQVLLFGTAYKGLAFVQSLPGQILNAAKSQQQYNNALQTATQDTGTFAKELLYVDNVQRAFGLNLETTRSGFTKLYASMAPADFDSGSIEKLFTGISAATAALQLTPDKAERVIYAFGQMASKGQIMSEELKGQLGDVLPGALAIFAKAAGMSIKEFSKAMEDGEFVGSKFRDTFAKVADELMRRFGTGAQAAGRSLQGLLNTVQGDFQRTLESFAPLADAAAQAILLPLSSSLSQLSKAASLAFGEQERVKKQLEDAKSSGANAQSIAALAAKLSELNAAARDPAIANQAKDIENFVTEVTKAARAVSDFAGGVGSILGPVFVALGTNLTGVVNTLGVLALSFAATRAAAMLAMGTLVTMNAVVQAGGSISAVAAARATVLAGVLRLVGVSATGAQVATIGFGMAVKGLLASTGIGLLVVALGSVATAFLNVGNKAAEAAERTKTAMAKMQDAIRTGNVEIAKADLYETTRRRNAIEDSIKLLDRLEQKGRKTGRGGAQIYAQTTLAERMELERVGYDLQGRTEVDVNQLRGQVPLLRNEAKNLEQRQKVGVELAERQRQRIGINEPKPIATLPADSGTEGKRERQLRDFNSEAIAQLRDNQRIAEEKLKQQRQLEIIDETEYEIASAANKRKFELLIIEEALAQKKADIGEYQVGVREKQLAVFEKLAANERELVKEEEKTAIQGAKIKLERPFKDAIRDENIEIQKQAMLLENLNNGYEGLTAEQEANLIIEDKTRELKARQQKLIETEIENLKEVTLERIKAARALQIEQTIKGLRDQLSLLRAISEEEQKRLRIAQENKDATAEQLNRIYDLEKVRDNIKAVRETIDSFVTDTSSDYKGFLKEVISGEDAVESLKKFQEGLKDRVLTIFLDFAMAPVEKFFKEGLSRFAIENFFPKGAAENMPEGTKPSTTPVEAQDKNTEETRLNTEAVKANTAALTGTGGAVPAPGQTAAAGTSGGFLTGTAALQTLPFNGQTGGMLQNLPFPAGDTGFLSAIGINGEELSASISESANAYSEQLSKVDTSVFESANALGTAGTELGKEGAAGKKWHESLGQAVGGLGMAAGAVMGIVAGINQIKEGGTSNVLGGIGMIASMAGSLLGNFGGLFGGGGGASSIVQGTDIPIAQMPAGMQFANGGVAFGGFRAFANGGTVSGPTLGLVGEGKYNEAIVPLPDGRSIPVQLGGRSARDLMGNGAPGMPQTPSLSMKFETTKINGVEYVSREQLEQAMAETRRASIAGGAKQGMSMTLDKIKQSPSTRSRIGMR